MTEAHESDSYLTIAAPAEAEIKIQGSRFIGFAYPVTTADAFQMHLNELKKKYYDATHHCFGYRLGFFGDDFRYSDDGEPNGTAGRRILGSIDRESLTDTGIVVIRYFGGTKLGVGGLARAYTDGADTVLQSAKIIRRYRKLRYQIQFPYDATKSVHHDIDTYNVEVMDKTYGEDVLYDIQIRESKNEGFKRDVTEHTQRTVVFLENDDKDV